MAWLTISLFYIIFLYWTLVSRSKEIEHSKNCIVVTLRTVTILVSYKKSFILSFDKLLLSYKEPLLSYNEPLLSYNEPLLSYHEPLLSYNEPLLSYNKPLLSYNKPLLSYNELLYCSDCLANDFRKEKAWCKDHQATISKEVTDLCIDFMKGHYRDWWEA